MVTPENGALYLKGQSGKAYSLNFYSSDVVGAAVTFNLSGVATANSSNFYILPENCQIMDISILTGQTVTTNWSLNINDQPIGVVIPVANALNTLATRSIPKTPLPAGRKFTMIQA
jgi:hypothetical protein